MGWVWLAGLAAFAVGIRAEALGRRGAWLLVTGAGSWLLVSQTTLGRWLMVLPLVQVVLGLGFLLPRRRPLVFAALCGAAAVVDVWQLAPLR